MVGIKGNKIAGCGRLLNLHNNDNWGSWIDGYFHFCWEEELGRGGKGEKWACGDETLRSINALLYCRSCIRKAGIIW